MTKELTIALAVGSVLAVVLFLYVYHNGGFARFCATPNGPCVDGHK